MKYIIKPIRVLGMEQWHVIIVDTDGTLLHQLTRWSDVGCRRDAMAWISSLQRSLGERGE